MSGNFNITLHIWRQAGPDQKGDFMRYDAKNVSPDMSFLELLDEVNDDLLKSGIEAVEFDHDCREGICGMCSLVINGDPHGPQRTATTCQLYMRNFIGVREAWVEPFRAKAFPIIKDLVVDRSALDKVLQAGGYISANTGCAPDANTTLIPKEKADLAMDAAACIGCGACVAACPNASAMLFTAAKISHLGLLPQGQPERNRRVQQMSDAMDKEGFGNCTNYRECELACPKEISTSFIARLNRDHLFSKLLSHE